MGLTKKRAAEGDDSAPAPAGREGRVLAVLPRALYRVALDGGHELTAHAVAGPRRNFVRLIVGDRVIVELTERDLGRGRIVRVVGR